MVHLQLHVRTGNERHVSFIHKPARCLIWRRPVDTSFPATALQCYQSEETKDKMQNTKYNIQSGCPRQAAMMTFSTSSVRGSKSVVGSALFFTAPGKYHIYIISCKAKIPKTFLHREFPTDSKLNPAGCISDRLGDLTEIFVANHYSFRPVSKMYVCGSRTRIDPSQHSLTISAPRSNTT